MASLLAAQRETSLPLACTRALTARTHARIGRKSLDHAISHLLQALRLRGASIVSLRASKIHGMHYDVTGDS